MTTLILMKWSLFFITLLILAYPLGCWISCLAEDTRIPLFLKRIENAIYRLIGVEASKHMGWFSYTKALLLFNLLGVFSIYMLQRFQGSLPFNPQAFSAVSADSAFNTAISFVTNTNWQGYAGESTMSYLTQMLGLTVQNFLSAATGITVVFALIRGLTSRSAQTIGNFWVDITRSTLFILLPLSMVIATFMMGQGVIQNLDAYKTVSLLEPVEYSQAKTDAKGQPVLDAKGNPVQEKVTTKTQTLAMGPVASQEAIKMLGTNGGGFFNANSAHPFENPTPLSNWIQMLSILLIPTALCFTFGHLVKDNRQGWTLLGAMILIFIAMLTVITQAEQSANPQLHAAISSATTNMEGKETRFGIIESSLFAAITTATSCGAVIAMHDSLMPLGGFITLGFMQLGEVVFGGVGSGLYGMLIMAILAVFIAGLMIGRTPEYLGKKIEAYEMKMVSIAILATPLLLLGGLSIAVLTDAGKAGISNPGAHGFSQLLYALSSAANNNGSAFGGLSANTPFFNSLLAIVMWLGRFLIIVPVLAIAGSLAAKKKLDAHAGTMPTHGMLFMVLLIGTILIVGALTYIPALALGPIAEHLTIISKGH
ncbi:MAG: potassium-transporting ATPase subunit KdpA [Pseudomonadota bacterium]